MTEYAKIETLYERDKATFKVMPGVFKNPVYNSIRTWRWTEKIDGTNMRVIFTPATQMPKAMGSSKFIDVSASVRIGGRTDNANIPGDLLHTMIAQFPVENFTESFQSPVILYGEGYGAGIQGGGGYGPTKKFILFDVFVDGQWWLNHENIVDVATKLGCGVVPDFDEMSIEEAGEIVRAGFYTRVSGASQDQKAEGLVGRTIDTLFDKRGHRLIVKLKTKDF